MDQSKINKSIPMTSVESGSGRELKSDVFYYTNRIVNVVMVGNRGERDWILIDTGLPKHAAEIKRVAEERFGKGQKPAAILLTHGHFDHVGNVVDLIKTWDVPVYAHELEFPYLTGKKSYPEPDPSVEGGLLAKTSFIYPHNAIDIGSALQPLPEEGEVPGLPGWQWIHTPGHSPGHVSFFRESDRTLVAGDAFVTVRQDSFYKVLVQKEEINGPPVYLTTDWPAAWESVKKLQVLHPHVAVTGHGTAFQGRELAEGLEELARCFDEVAIPQHGKYVGNIVQ